VFALVLCGADFDEIAEHFGVTRRTVRNIQQASATNYSTVFAAFVWFGSKRAFCQQHISGELEAKFTNIKLPPKGE
jgi:predicted transcriptional regulator